MSCNLETKILAPVPVARGGLVFNDFTLIFCALLVCYIAVGLDYEDL